MTNFERIVAAVQTASDNLANGGAPRLLPDVAAVEEIPLSSEDHAFPGVSVDVDLRSRRVVLTSSVARLRVLYGFEPVRAVGEEAVVADAFSRFLRIGNGVEGTA